MAQQNKGARQDGKTIKVVQVRSCAGRPQRVKKQLDSIGLGRIGQETTLPATPSVVGVVRKLAYLVEVGD